MSKSRMSHVSQRLAATSSVFSTRKERSFSSRAKRTSENGFAEQFRSICAELGIAGFPDVKITFTEPENGFRDWSGLSQAKVTSKVQESRKPPQILVVLKTEATDEVNMVILKQYSVTNDLLCALQKTFNMQQRIRVLKLEFCNLDHRQIKAVKYLLQQNPSIDDLSLNGNPNEHQNFYVLLKGTGLLFLSLKCCRINDGGVERISKCLADPFTQTLLAINLASNFITDNGAQHIANTLRSNRCLVHLNIADNFLSDNGCIWLMEVLQKFPLRHSEIVIRRRRNLANLLKVIKLKEESELSNLQKSSDSVIANSAPRKVKNRPRKSSKDKTSASSESSVKNKKSKEMKPVESNNIELPKDPHPFVAESYPENKEIYCRGNLKVSRLNLSYNKISAEGLQAVVDVLKYQIEQSECVGGSKGLTRLILEGNNLSECGFEVEAISDLMSQTSNRRSSVQCSKSGSRSASRKLVSKITI